MTIGQTLANARAKLQRRFSNKSNVIQTRGGATRLTIQSMHPHWIVGRDLCMFRCESFEHVPAGKRRQALALKLPVWSPFERTGHHSVWIRGFAMVWIWNADEVQAEREAGHVAPDAADARILPETVFLPNDANGLVLQACREGCELQYWRDGLLHDSYWLAETPSEDTVNWFRERQAVLHAAAEGEDREVQPVERPSQFNAVPWAGLKTPAQWLEANERPLVACCLLALVLVLAWQETRIWKLRGLETAAATELVELQGDVTPVLEARNEWLELRRRNEVLGNILLDPSQAHLMGLIDQAIPSATARFHSWRYQQRELRFVIEDDEPNPIEYVRSLQAQPLFREVKTQPTRWPNRIEVTLQVVP